MLKSAMSRCSVVLAGMLLLIPQVHAQSYDTLRIATYNLLNYPGGSSSTRNPEFRKILRIIDPDVLVVQEMTSSSGITDFLDNVLNHGQPGTYSAAPFNDGPDTDNALFFKPVRVSFIGPQTVLHTQLRDINGYRLRPTGLNADSLDIQVFSAHLKANPGEESARLAEADTLRNHLNGLPDGSFIAAGDFNLYTSAEPAYQELIGSQSDNSGRLYDPINSPGDWHDDPASAPIHTQSTRTENLGDGGATGGLDDRFDFVLLSYNFQTAAAWQYVSGSYLNLGNDGNHLNQSVNQGVNSAVPDSIADALHMVSDHLPVLLTVRRQLGAPASVTVLVPNGGEAWTIGTPYNIQWSSQSLPGTVSIRLNRSFPNGVWENIVVGTANDGIQSWTVTAPPAPAARVQIISDELPEISDVSDSNFSLVSASLSVIVPNGGEVWNIADTVHLVWNPGGIGGSIRVELDRAFPSGNWEIVKASTANDGTESWAITGPAATQCRIRIWSISQPLTGDTSDAAFRIRLPNQPPVIVHDPHEDALPGSVTFTAHMTDDEAVAGAVLVYWHVGSQADSTTMFVTGYPDEYGATIEIERGHVRYYLRAWDAEGGASATDTLSLCTADTSRLQVAYDDGTAEHYQWSPHDSVEWAVKFTPPALPFALVSAEVAVAGFHPDTTHTPVHIRVLSADGPNGSPGTELCTFVKGSVGNLAGGLPYAGTHWITAFMLSDSLSPLQLTSSFYVAVGNEATPGEAFGLDTSSALAGRSFVYDPCTAQWESEDHWGEVTRRGNRMIRVSGWTASPMACVIHRDGNEIRMHWSDSGAPYFRVYKSLTSDFTVPEFVASTTDTSLTVGQVEASPPVTFYHVVSSNLP